MKLEFYKYQGAGNDFIMIDNRDQSFPKDNVDIEKLCHRYFGIGADGLILLENDSAADFRMVYYNSDGRESTMCGNGGRCIVAFAKQLGIIDEQTTFIAKDGLHKAEFVSLVTYITYAVDFVEPSSSEPKKNIRLQMNDVSDITIKEGSCFLDTGSPHHIEMVEDLANYNVVDNGRRIRYADYGTEGSNVNFVEKSIPMHFNIRTYERGVEDETLACGTGATAAAIAMHKTQQIDSTVVFMSAKGGTLQVSFDEDNGHYTNVWLQGPTEFVYKGEIEV